MEELVGDGQSLRSELDAAHQELLDKQEADRTAAAQRQAAAQAAAEEREQRDAAAAAETAAHRQEDADRRTRIAALSPAFIDLFRRAQAITQVTGLSKKDGDWATPCLWETSEPIHVATQEGVEQSVRIVTEGVRERRRHLFRERKPSFVGFQSTFADQRTEPPVITEGRTHGVVDPLRDTWAKSSEEVEATLATVTGVIEAAELKLGLTPDPEA